jgi:hypothetical protein
MEGRDFKVTAIREFLVIYYMGLSLVRVLDLQRDCDYLSECPAKAYLNIDLTLQAHTYAHTYRYRCHSRIKETIQSMSSICAS